ncbi:putative pre-mRNA splicing factor [Aspergillus clavatus NRRL 1]|uniref:Pre-mRNA splicing factor, putative n=1 Tax=Aspergillus clavatus (strain ATCC 1007 / CBS 513.65 / DSM 816 / NCTC 3887 / NRRL 1 / QM 1276 / 107) TaxID=344612 RepID=A1CDG0_ASPCL|nr:pre-mRNA splicing factor, putative [Aspergillus clavatus NRRL 1]EAW11887.1 pre-mRNA splicing factor, putative [Aspergillus clavatus NRRL 1]
MSPSSVSVVIPPPTIDLDSYEPFGEVYSRTVDEILSDEASFDATFDSYTGAEVMGEAGAGRKRGRKRGSNNVAGHTKSPYFNTGQRAQRSAPVEEHISETETEDEDEDEDNEEEDDSPAAIDLVDEDMCDMHNNSTEGVIDDATEADIIFASVGVDTRYGLLEYIASHSFMCEGVYPVERSKRRAFVRQVRKKAKSAGLDEEAIVRLTRYVKKTYLELYGKGCTVTQGSEYGDEIDDEEEYERKSSNLFKEERKRKRANGGKGKEKSKKSKKVSTCMTNGPPVRTDDHTEHEVIDLDAEDPEDVSVNASPDPKAVKNFPVPRGSIDGRRLSIPKPLKKSLRQVQRTLPSSATAEKGSRNNSIAQARKYTFHSTSVSHDEPICLESEIDVIKEPFQVIPAASRLDSPSPEPEMPEERARRLKKERNRRKHEARKRRKAQRQRESMGFTEVEEPAVNDPPLKHTANKHPWKDRGVTASDEVKSKYFLCAAQVDGAAPLICSASSSTFLDNSMKTHWTISEDIRNILQEFDLPSDFLESDADSVLSDVSISSDTFLEDDDSFVLQTALYRDRAVTPLEQLTLPPIEMEIPADHPQLPLSGTLRPGLPKVSPYFPKPLMNPDSCLPFPSIDAPTFGLVQEQLAHDPFRLLVATIFLNRTRGGVALPVLFKVFDQYPTVEEMSKADLLSLVSMIHCLGFQNQRAQKCIGLAQTWLARPPTRGKRYRKLHYPCRLDGKDVGCDECIADDDSRVAWEIAHLPGVGAYSLDSWRIFCRDGLRGLAKDWKGDGATSADFVPEWKSVLPQDKELRAYLTWMWLKEGWIWDRHTGERKRASEKTMRAARRGGVAHEMEGNWVLETSPVKKAANGLTDWSWD